MSLVCDFRVVGPVQTNCYFLFDKETKECVIVDPGDEAEKILRYIRNKQLKVTAILLTHGHFDHIGAVDYIYEHYHCPIYIHQEDIASRAEKIIIESTTNNLSSVMSASCTTSVDEYLEDGQEIELLGQTVRCILTPGHTIGGMCFYFPKAGILFSGDTLFQESVGRTDFPTGSMSQIIHSIREKLLILPPAVRVYPGHGMTTSIGEEKMYNPYAGGSDD